VSSERRLLSILEPLFELGPASIDVVLSQCADLIAAGLESEKVDAFLYEGASDSLVAIGTSHTPLAALQRRLGLNRLAIANGDPMSKVFRSGECYRTGHADQDSTQPRGVIDSLGVRSMAAAPIDVAGVRRGVLSLASPRTDAFSADDLALLRIVAHDVRNLLQPIIARVSLMRERADGEGRTPDAQDAVRALAGLGRLSAIVTDLLDVARLDTGMLALKRDRLELVALLRATAETLRPPDVEVRVDSFCEQLHLQADGDRLRQALENVLSNAIKHSPRTAAVVLALESTRNATAEVGKIVISDQGPGIQPDLLPRIFDRFVAGEHSAGLGLGLYLARAIVVAHGGTIEMHSVVGQGTRCEILLPLVHEAEAGLS